MPHSSTSQWTSAALSRAFLEHVHGAIPCADLQIEILLKIIAQWRPQVASVLDIGCGDALLGRAVSTRFPGLHLTGIDISATMLAAAHEKISMDIPSRFIRGDIGSPEWRTLLAPPSHFDLIISGFAIHHQPHDRKRALYKEIFDLLEPGGLFLNLEHVASPTPSVTALFEDHFIDQLVAFHHRTNPDLDRQAIADQYYNRPDKAENILAPVSEQCDWLREIGFQDVDCFFKVFELALFGGRKSTPG